MTALAFVEDDAGIGWHELDRRQAAVRARERGFEDELGHGGPRHLSSTAQERE